MRGKKLDLSIGANFDDDWGVIEEKKNSVKTELLPPEKHQLVFKFEKRRGKPVTLIGPILLAKDDTELLLKKMKKLLGSGGTFKEGFMEFQGECKERLRDLFTKEGFRFKK